LSKYLPTLIKGSTEEIIKSLRVVSKEREIHSLSNQAWVGTGCRVYRREVVSGAAIQLQFVKCSDLNVQTAFKLVLEGRQRCSSVVDLVL